MKCPRRTEHCQVGPKCFRNAHLLETCTKSCRAESHTLHWFHRSCRNATELPQLPADLLSYLLSYLLSTVPGLGLMTPGLVTSSRFIQNVPSTSPPIGEGHGNRLELWQKPTFIYIYIAIIYYIHTHAFARAPFCHA